MVALTGGDVGENPARDKLLQSVTLTDYSFDNSIAIAETLGMASTPQTSGNYIHQLQMTVREQHNIIAATRECYLELVTYLTSEKFHNDTTVQVADVLRRLETIAWETLPDNDKLVAKLTKPVIATGEITSL